LKGEKRNDYWTEKLREVNQKVGPPRMKTMERQIGGGGIVENIIDGRDYRSSFEERCEGHEGDWGGVRRRVENRIVVYRSARGGQSAEGERNYTGWTTDGKLIINSGFEKEVDQLLEKEVWNQLKGRQDDKRQECDPVEETEGCGDSQ
jgi:hypothetical protein